MLDIKISLSKELKEKPKDNLGFGRIFTDHMFLMNYTQDTGWHDARIVPYADFSLPPSSAVFHYGQEIFEGMKAYLDANNNGFGKENNAAYLFRPEQNARRSNSTSDRLCIPQIPEDDYVQAVHTLVNIDREWIPDGPAESLYIRPFIIATEPYLGVAPSKSYLFSIIMSPSGSYYSKGLKPISIWVEDSYARAVRGGVGFAKAGGNYAASLLVQEKAAAAGYDQVLWLDAIEHRFVEEVGSMNIFFVIDDEVITPELSGSILPGITRDSVITLCNDWGYKVSERSLSIDEVMESQKNGALQEVFGTGTAAVITSVGTMHYKDYSCQVADGKIGKLTKNLYDTLTGIQTGILDDPYGWRVSV